MSTTGVFLIATIKYAFSVSIDDVDWTSFDIGNQLQFNEFRTIDGTGNNQNNLDFGKTFGNVVRCVNPVYGDGFNSLTGQNRPNPREISNIIFDQTPEDDSKFVTDRFLTQFTWQWGQFIDHDLSQISEDESDNDLSLDIDIDVPECDAVFDSTCEGDIFINVFRTAAVRGTGTGPNNPRIIFNDITSFIDGSMVYGSDSSNANNLREFSDGLLKVSLASNGDTLLPVNENNDFIAGDSRVNEQTGLIVIHTIFVRAHNIIATNIIDGVRQFNPTATSTEIDELTYQYAKLILTAIIQKINYDDYLPIMFGTTAINLFLGNYIGYNDTINPGVCAIFASAAFRFGHTQLPQRLPRRTSSCDGSNNDLELRDAFEVPEFVIEDPDIINEMINGFSCTLANKIDTKITGGVRHFLFESLVDENGDPELGLLDLVSLNIQRGRDHGLPNYNQVRQAIGLTPLTSFDQISSDAALNFIIRTLYNNDINNIDLFVGMLAEDRFTDGSFGETISSIVLSQFKRSRDGDRFWYENYIKDGSLLDFVKSVTLKDILEWTTDMDIETLDNNDNIFQNGNAISVFDVTSIDDSSSNDDSSNDNSDNALNNALSNIDDKYIVIKIREHDLLNYFGIGLFGFGLICIFVCICNKCISLNANKKYKMVKVDNNEDIQEQSLIY